MRNIIIACIVTALVLIEGYFVYFVVDMKMDLTKNTKTIEQIVGYLNSQIEKSTPAQ